MKQPEIAKRIQEILHEVTSDAQVILFRSEAQGDTRSDSDYQKTMGFNQ